MPILGSVINQQQYASASYAVGEHIEECLSFGIDPMQVFEDDHVARATSHAGGCHHHPPASSAAHKTSPATSLGSLHSTPWSASPGALAPPAPHRPAAQGWLALAPNSH